MSQVSRRFIKPETEAKINDLFEDCLTFCSTKESTKTFINDLLSPTEKTMLSKRLAIAYLLLKKYPYETIKSLLKVSQTTIGSVSLMLKSKGDGLTKAFEKVNQKKYISKTLEDLADTVIEILSSGKGGSWTEAGKARFRKETRRNSAL